MIGKAIGIIFRPQHTWQAVADLTDSQLRAYILYPALLAILACAQPASALSSPQGGQGIIHDAERVPPVLVVHQKNDVGSRAFTSWLGGGHEGEED